MEKRNWTKLVVPPAVLAILTTLAVSGTSAADTGRKIDFNRDIRPILSAHCFQCHGPDAGKRKAELRLDTRQGALAARDGHQTIAAGQPDKSELFLRITSASADEKMPPAAAKRPLSRAQIQLIRQWISQGANWQEHWAWVTPSSTSSSTSGR